jgi:hypothetical protein
MDYTQHIKELEDKLEAVENSIEELLEDGRVPDEYEELGALYDKEEEIKEELERMLERQHDMKGYKSEAELVGWRQDDYI